ncbi:MAG TPA: SRPBCC family protein [Terriglobales bacterium]|nr:SRPBCC family protein [Terriglobales bacterium]
MRTREANFWTGLAAGAALGVLAGAGAVLAFRRRISDANSRVVRLEKSVNVGSPVHRVFNAWSNLEQLPRWINFVKSVHHYGRHSRWVVDLDGREFEWSAQITQVIPNESIGWKSLSGPKHTGRITFSPAGDQTVLHVLMNYAPPLGAVGAMMPVQEVLELWIERGLREFKAGLEKERQQPGRRTGTTGSEGVWDTSI